MRAIGVFFEQRLGGGVERFEIGLRVLLVGECVADFGQLARDGGVLREGGRGRGEGERGKRQDEETGCFHGEAKERWVERGGVAMPGHGVDRRWHGPMETTAQRGRQSFFPSGPVTGGARRQKRCAGVRARFKHHGNPDPLMKLRLWIAVFFALAGTVSMVGQSLASYSISKVKPTGWADIFPAGIISLSRAAAQQKNTDPLTVGQAYSAFAIKVTTTGPTEVTAEITCDKFMERSSIRRTVWTADTYTFRPMIKWKFDALYSVTEPESAVVTFRLLGKKGKNCGSRTGRLRCIRSTSVLSRCAIRTTATARRKTRSR